MDLVTLDHLLPLSAVALAGIVAIAVAVRYPRAGQSWLLLAGMVTLGAAVILDALSNVASEAESLIRLQRVSLGLHTVIPAIWLAFSVMYARGNPREYLYRWRWEISAAFLVPVVLAGAFWSGLIQEPSKAESQGWMVAFGPGGTVLTIVLLLVAVAMLVNIEATFWASVGITRWRIKYVALGVAVIFGARIYARGQGVLYSGQPLNVTVVESAALLIGAALLAI